MYEWKKTRVCLTDALLLNWLGMSISKNLLEQREKRLVHTPLKACSSTAKMTSNRPF